MSNPDPNARPIASDWSSWLADRLVGYRSLLFFAALALAAAALLPATQLDFDQSLEALYAPDNPRLIDFVRSKQSFGGDELAIVAYHDPDLMTPAGLARARALGEAFDDVPGLLTDSEQNLDETLGTLEKTLQTFGRVPGLARRVESVRTAAISMFEGILVGPDRETTAVILRFAPRELPGVPPRGVTVQAIRAIADAHNPPAHVVGEPVQVHDMFQFVEEDSRLLGYASLLLLTVVILALFRGFRWVALPIVVVQVSLLWTKGLLTLSGMQLSMVSSTLTSLVMVIGVATVVHFMFTFRELRGELEPVPAMTETLRQLLHPVFWTTATTAAGFSVQMLTSIHPAYTFGLMMTLATLLVLVATLALLPAGILAGQAKRERLRAFEQNRWISKALAALCRGVERSPGRIAVAGSVVTAGVLVGCVWLHVETDFSKNFRSQTPIVQALNFVEQNLGGAGTWEVNFAAPEDLESNPEFLDKVRDLSDRLRELQSEPSLRASDGQPALTKVMAPTDGIDLLPRLPLLGLRFQLKILNAFQPEFLPSLYNPAAMRMRILLRARERQSSETKLRLISEVERIAAETLGDPTWELSGSPQPPRATGLFVLLAYLIESLLADQWVSGIAAAVLLTAMMAVAFQSVTIGLVSLIPNLLPIGLVIGTMGWLGMPINIATAMIASVSMGLTIDSSVHFLSGLKRGRAAGLDFPEALHVTYQSVGSALVYANIALVLGFLTLTLSNFVPLIYFGALVAVAMVGGLLGNLVILPVMLALLERSPGRSPAAESVPEELAGRKTGTPGS